MLALYREVAARTADLAVHWQRVGFVIEAAHYYQHRDIPAALQAGAELGRKAASGYGGVTGC